MEDFSFQKKKNFYFLRKRTVFEIFIFVSLLELIFVLFIFDIIPLRNFWASVMPNVLIDLANNFRSENNLNKLTPSPLLEEAARLKAEDMAKKGYFAHTSPEGIDPWYWFEKVGYDFVYAGENLAVNFYDSKTLHQAWLESPKHKKNIVNKNFTEIGIATAKGVYKGKEAVFVVQLFGKPRSKLSYTPGVVIRDKEKEPLSKPPNSVEGEVKSAEFLPPEIVKEENSAQIVGETEEELSKKEDFIEVTSQPCPKCGEGKKVVRFGKFGRFFSCSRFPECDYKESLNASKEKKEVKRSDKKCPKCGGNLLERKSRYGKFLGCENYPKCTYIESFPVKTFGKCPKCGGEIVLRKTKKGRIFYGCNNFPKCSFASWQKP